jgi:hypothetical protein
MFCYKRFANVLERRSSVWGRHWWYSIFFLYCCDGWGYIVAFTQALKLYQKYHTWIHFLNHSPLSPHPLRFLQWFQQVSFLHLLTCVHIFCTIFTLLLSSPQHFPPPISVSPPPLGRTVSPNCSPICRRKKRKWKTWHFILLYI